MPDDYDVPGPGSDPLRDLLGMISGIALIGIIVGGLGWLFAGLAGAQGIANLIGMIAVIGILILVVIGWLAG
jgi:hypothetical protein